MTGKNAKYLTQKCAVSGTDMEDAKDPLIYSNLLSVLRSVMQIQQPGMQ